MQRFQDRTVLITGAASGIGRASAERLASEGARVACLDRDGAGAEETAERVRKAGPDALARACDVSQPDAVAAAVTAVVEAFGALHGAVNAAGILRFVHTHEETLDDWNRVLAVNLTGTFLVSQAVLPHLLATRGALVNMSSTAVLRAHPWAAAYSASKGGVQAFTRMLAIEYGRQGLRANCVCAGGIDTPIQGAFALPEGADPKLLKRIMPFTGFAEAERCASAIAFLLSDDAAHVNGEFLTVDGAMCA